MWLHSHHWTPAMISSLKMATKVCSRSWSRAQKSCFPAVTKGYNHLNLAIDFDMLSVENLTFPWHGDRRLKMCLTKLNGHDIISICFLWFSTFLISSVIIFRKGKWIRVYIYRYVYIYINMYVYISIYMYRLWEHLLSWSCLKKWNPVPFWRPLSH